MDFSLANCIRFDIKVPLKKHYPHKSNIISVAKWLKLDI
jgi:hypothetical protein